MTHLLPGQMLGSYRIISQIGEGGMATVYKAYQASMDRHVALKVLPSHLANSKEFAGRFQQEARIIGNLEHPHILPVFDSGESDGVSYLVMRYLEAGTLQEKLETRPLSLNAIDRIFTQLADALSYAHSRGVIHRDLKPSNALIDSQGNLFLTDFGIAKILEGTAKFTRTDTVMGTPAYISPEQAQGQVADRRSDIYSLGIILYEMVTGRVPFTADTPLAVIYKHVNDPLPLPSSIKPDLPAQIERVLLKALAKSPNDRFGTVEEFSMAWKQAFSMSETSHAVAVNDDKTMRYEDLNKKAQPLHTEGIPKTGTPKPARRGLWIGCLTGICLLFGIGGASLIALNGQGLPFLNPSEEYFEIEIGDEISSGEPDDGAGIIESPGSRDIYTFSAEEGEEIFIHILEAPESSGNIIFSLTDDQGSNIFSTCLGCGDPGLILFERGGKYTMTVGNDTRDGAGSGPYRIKLWEVPPREVFSIELGQEVSKNQPGEGAGFIQSPGAMEIYTFTAEAGQDVYFQIMEPLSNNLIFWSMDDEAGNTIFDTCLQCGDPGSTTLERGGIYTMYVGGTVGTGSFAFKLWVIPPPDIFEIEIGASISPNSPGTGAGIIESPGAHDMYTFTATAGLTVAFEVTNTTEVGDAIPWRLEDQDQNELFDTCLECGNPNPIAFEKDGTYTIIVGSETSPGVGEYEFQIFFP